MVKTSTGFLLLLSLATSPAISGEEVLYSFPDQSYPVGNLTETGAGSFVSTTYGLSGYGTVFRLKRKASDWRFETIHEFDGTDGSNPLAGLIYNKSARMFYGVTANGGTNNGGTVFSLTPSGRETVLYSFSYANGVVPSAALLQDNQSGTLYGTTVSGGDFDCGTIFSLSGGAGKWAFSTLYNFQNSPADGCGPITPLVEGPTPGVFVGSTYEGGSNNAGTLFTLTNTAGTWSEAVIHSFKGDADGIDPYDVVRSRDGTIYGVVKYGGPTRNGALFKLAFKAGVWTYKIIHGMEHTMSPVALYLDDDTGTLYGAAAAVGIGNGDVFKLERSGSKWTETILHHFTGGADGSQPEARPILDRTTGILYGTTSFGGEFDGGTVYMISP
jgi:uncharacterized repeat protein (TIGR03803 family)